ncbi:MAG: hypothetical protein KJZ73_08135 [Pseudorhodoplanes sp.]|nr:hypothetical protein [Pseudorhodoplanes sp.]MBW7950885.1 hypothetical protein [Pseudorhodoplanes sp.]MCL4711203.1 hypothetical protein [Pseudorhodoplanes sp.]GIK79032.1 MAG: hypothetical protein BroJett024_01370 [Alphaproteobacteria bacterium]
MTAVRFWPAVIMLCLAVAGCGGGDFSSAVGDANEQARLKLVDQCMFDRSSGADPKDRTRGPRCQCYARTVAKQMSPSEASAFVASGAVPLSVKTTEVMASCRRG